jgi:hypothetical protein
VDSFTSTFTHVCLLDLTKARGLPPQTSRRLLRPCPFRRCCLALLRMGVLVWDEGDEEDEEDEEDVKQQHK